MPNTSSRLIGHLLALRNRHFFGLDVVLLLLSPTLALALRTDGLNVQPRGWDVLNVYIPGLLLYTGLALLVRLAVFYRMGLYSRYWRYASIEELDQISWAVLWSTAVLLAIILVARTPWVAQTGFPLWNFPRSVAVIDGLLTLALVGGTRFSVRLATHWKKPRQGRSRRVVVMGAGDAGSMIVREMQRNPALGMEPVGFLDDDIAKQGVRIYGVPVLGTHKDIPNMVQSYKANQVIIAMPTAPGKVIREIVDICEHAGAQTKIIPGMYELLDGTVSVNHLRNVEIEDLLRRAPVQTDIEAVASLIRGKRVLVTGGGGSIGSELCRQIRRCRPSELIVLGHGENSVFDITNELNRLEAREYTQLGNGYGPMRIHPVIADIRFHQRIHDVFARYQPQIVFHAAAHKHVPLMENNPAEAISNNVGGTRNVVDAALAMGVENFVMISTDKAVNPTSIMGASKRSAELLVHQAAQRSGKSYVAVRFGNVLGSRGSVVLTFKQQIAAGGPITITHPDMERFFMTIPEAVQLVLQAAVLGKGGEVFVLDMGEPVKIVELARDLIELSGLQEGRDIDIAFTGIRPGEKLYEELFIPGEVYARTRHEKIFIAGNASSFVDASLNDAIDALLAASQRDDTLAIFRSLKNLIPESQLTVPGGEAISLLSPPAQEIQPSLRVSDSRSL